MLRITDPSGQGLAFPLLPIAVVFEEPTDGWVAIGGDDGVNLQLWITLHQCLFHDVYVVFKTDVKPLAVVCPEHLQPDTECSMNQVNRQKKCCSLRGQPNKKKVSCTDANRAECATAVLHVPLSLGRHVVTAQVMDRRTEEQVAQQGVTVRVLARPNVDLSFAGRGPLATRFKATVGEVDRGTIAIRSADGTKLMNDFEFLVRMHGSSIFVPTVRKDGERYVFELQWRDPGEHLLTIRLQYGACPEDQPRCVRPYFGLVVADTTFFIAPTEGAEKGPPPRRCSQREAGEAQGRWLRPEQLISRGIYDAEELGRYWQSLDVTESVLHSTTAYPWLSYACRLKLHTRADGLRCINQSSHSTFMGTSVDISWLTKLAQWMRGEGPESAAGHSAYVFQIESPFQTKHLQTLGRSHRFVRFAAHSMCQRGSKRLEGTPARNTTCPNP